MTSTNLHRNPFWVLRVSPRDSRQVIVERADEALLLSDSDGVEGARLKLLNARTRIEAEIAWLPGVRPSTSFEVVQGLLRHPGRFINPPDSFSPLAHANLLSATLERFDPLENRRELGAMIHQFAVLVSSISATDVQRLVNEDRVAGGFAEIPDVGLFDSALSDRERHFRDTVRNLLDKLPPEELVEVLTETIQIATKGGTTHAPPLLEGIVDVYALDAQEFLRREGENLDVLVEQVRALAAARGPESVRQRLLRLIEVASNWDRVAQPIQLSFQARGKEHEPSTAVANTLRRLAVDLNNRHGLVEEAQDLVRALRSLFAELPEFVEQADQDLDALDELARGKAKAVENDAQWAKDITYRAEVGAVIKTTLEISPNGVYWGEVGFDLHQVSRIRWGGVRHGVVGVPVGATYQIGFGDDRHEAVVTLHRMEVFQAFTQRLFRAVGARLMLEHVRDLKEGKAIRFDTLVLRDNGLELPDTRFFGSGGWHLKPWSQVEVWSAEGFFHVRALDDRKLYAMVSYQAVANTHVLDGLVRMVLKSGHSRLSDTLR